MAWDSKRPVPWKPLLRLVGVFVVLINVFLYFSQSKNYNSKVFATTLMAGLAYLAFVVILAKFGMDPITQREKRMAAAAERRAERQAAKASGSQGRSPRSGTSRKAVAADTHGRPKATSRTNAGNRQRHRRS